MACFVSQQQHLVHGQYVYSCSQHSAFSQTMHRPVDFSSLRLRNVVVHDIPVVGQSYNVTAIERESSNSIRMSCR